MVFCRETIMPSTNKTAMLLKQLFQELPRLLREDALVRGEVIGILSDYLTTREETAAILAEIRQMRADFDRRMDEQGKRIEEQGKRIEEQGKRIEEQGKRIEEQGERIAGHTLQIASLERTLGAIGARWGILSEEAFRGGVRGLLVTQPDLRVEEWRCQDSAGRVFGYPAEIQVDVVLRDGSHTLVEIKSSASAGDVASFARKGELYHEVTGRLPDRLVLISPFVDERAHQAAARLGVQVHTGTAPPPLT
jgi:hypothetical protein